MLNDNHLKRVLRVVRHTEDNRVIVNGRTLINFASNDYLGLSRHPEVIKASIDATQTYGTGSGSSPLLSGFTELHQTLCEFLSDWKSDSGKLPCKTLLLPTGFAANLSVLSAVLQGDCQVFCDRKNHASIIDGLRLAEANNPAIKIRYYRHRDYVHLESLLNQSKSTSTSRNWIISDSVFSMDGTIASPEQLLSVADRYRAGVIIDEAHATGVIGENGAGLYSLERKSGYPILTVGTLSKALGALGGFVVGTSDWIDRILQASRPLIYSTALPCGVVAAALAAAKITRSNHNLRRTLTSTVETIHQQLAHQGWTLTGDLQAPLLSVVVGSADVALTVAKRLEEKGIFAPAIRPPTVRPRECRIRISPTATMTNHEMTILFAAFADLAQEYLPGSSTVEC